MKKVFALITILGLCMGTYAASHVFWYKSDTKNYVLTTNPGPNLPADVIKHGGMLMTAALAQHSGNPDANFVFGSGLDDIQGRCGVVWSMDLCSATGTADSAFFRAEFRDGWAGNAFCNAGLIKIRCGVVDFQGNIDSWGASAADVPATATWQDALNPISGTMGYDMNTTVLQAEEVINFTAPAGRPGEADESQLDKQFVKIDVTDQVNWILSHPGGQYAIVCLTKPGEGSVGKVNTLADESCAAVAFGSDAAWTTDGNTAHFLVYSSNLAIAVEKNVVKAVKTALVQNQPNPFTGSTAISYNTGNHVNGMVKVYDASGKVVFSSTVKGSGSLSWNASSLANGIYVCRLVAGNETLSRNMILMK